ncbi:MAG: NAD(P)H-hydrate dehydratase [Clostridia bacterium]|nr:NAD(P)H-hydrate dehydratase [Clostridia bacterium]
MKELTLKDVFDVLPKRAKDSNKGDYGRLLSVVGCKYYRGAAVLSSLGALRTGVGILTVCSTEQVIQTVAAALPEATFLPRDELDITDIPKVTAVLCGCGLGKDEGVAEIVKGCPVPMILDADGLNNIRAEYIPEGSIITPHIGEFSRLAGISIPDIKSDPEKQARSFADRYNVTVVLKDYETVITSPEKETAVSRFGNPGLARGGSGDVLAGMIASFRAQGMSSYDAAVCGTVLHGASADLCAKRLSQQTMLPHDILDDLTTIFNERGI